MTQQILMVTGSHDRTCDYLIQKYPQTPFFRLNTDQFSKYTITINARGFEISNGRSSITTSTCATILYRKPIPEDVSDVFDSKYHKFAHIEAFSIIEGLVESFNGPCLSKPSIMRRANNKIVQLELATKMGFSIPASAITNSIDALEQLQNVQMIVKPLAIGVVMDGCQKEFVQTNFVSSSVDTSLLRYAPAYFQGYIEKDYELRVTIIGNECHSVRIDSEDKIDWRRPGNNITYTHCNLPDDVQKKSMAFMRELNIEFGCFDFIVKNGTYYFLEMNANGQWAWLDNFVNSQISDSLVRYLSK